MTCLDTDHLRGVFRFTRELNRGVSRQLLNPTAWLYPDRSDRPSLIVFSNRFADLDSLSLLSWSVGLLPKVMNYSVFILRVYPRKSRSSTL